MPRKAKKAVRAKVARQRRPVAGAVGALAVRPLTPELWPDFERLFGPRGACAGCWCMLWRSRASEYEKNKGAGNKRAMKRIVHSGQTPGLIGYVGGEPAAWLALGPRETYVRLTTSRVLKPVDDVPVWSVTCFFVARAHRRRGLGVAMLQAAIQYATQHHARMLEGYPVEPRQDNMPDAFAWTGLAEQFRRAGFQEVARRSDTRPIMRFELP